jgi:putative transposase
MPFIKILIHSIFSTKNRKRIISKELKPKLLSHVRENAELKNIYIDTINCVEDHMHIIISLKADQTISKVMQLIKGESSNWVNKNKLLSHKFEWQDEYIAISFSASNLQKVRDYINNQEEHHKKNSFDEEYRKIIELLREKKNG